MRFTEQFGIAKGSQDDWFDPLLTQDTRLFVDPFLIFDDQDPRWSEGHAKLVSFFNLVLRLVARSGGQASSAIFRAAGRLLTFPEPAEFCLGMAATSVQGAGTGAGLMESMLQGCRTAIQAGVQRVRHFEELVIFSEGIGLDRISDITCNVLKEEFASYTQGVSREHGIPLEEVRLRHASWSLQNQRWIDRTVPIPVNPFARGRVGVLLTPARFLRHIPTVSPEDFWDWSYTNHGEQLRAEFNYDIGRRVDAREIIRLARRRPEWVRQYVRQFEEERPSAYRFDTDPDFVHAYERGAELAREIQLAPPTDQEAFCDWVGAIGEIFRQAVENQGMWRLLHNDDGSARKEAATQNLFRSVVIHYCRANNVDFSGETNAGRGPVDFKFSQGWGARALLEVKLMSNTKFWNGLELQLPTYLTAEEIRCGHFLCVGFHESDFTEEKVNRVRRVCRARGAELGVSLRPVFVNATRPPSASRGRRPR